MKIPSGLLAAFLGIAAVPVSAAEKLPVFELPYITTSSVVELLTDIRYYTTDFSVNGRKQPFDNRVTYIGSGPGDMHKVIGGYPNRIPLNALLRPGKNEFVFKLRPSELDGEPISAHVQEGSLLSLDRVYAEVAIVGNEAAASGLGQRVGEWQKQAQSGALTIFQSASLHPESIKEIQPAQLRLVIDTKQLGLEITKPPIELCKTQIWYGHFSGEAFLNDQLMAEVNGNGSHYSWKSSPALKLGKNVFSIKVRETKAGEEAYAELNIRCDLKSYAKALKEKKGKQAGNFAEYPAFSILRLTYSKPGTYATTFVFK